MEEICNQVELIAREAGCKYMTGTVDVDSVNPIRSIKMMATGGYSIHSANNNIIVMIKYLGE